MSDDTFDMGRPGVTMALAIIAGLAVVGFLVGTRTDDYGQEAPLVQPFASREGAAPAAKPYSQLRTGTTSDGSLVARDCGDCHEDKIAQAHKGDRTEHPVGVEVPAGADLSRLFAAGGRTKAGEDGAGTLICQTCHRPHNAEVDARLIVTADEGALCLSCHADHGPTRSLHPVSLKLDRAARAKVAALGGVAGDRLTCLSCHDPHESTAGTLLRTDGKGGSACLACHEDKHAQLGRGGHASQGCVDCHGMHRASSKRGGGATAEDARDQPCVDCHTRRGASKAKIDLASGHPMWRDLPERMAGEDETGRVGCHTCHQAHSSQPSLLSRGGVEQTCLACHDDKRTVAGTDHDAAVVGVAGARTVCLSCHAVHGGSKVPKPPAGVNPAAGACLRCHDGRTEAKQVAQWTHPKGLLFTAAGLPFRYSGDIPYFGPDGRRTTDRETGEIACLTCHDPHRWKHGDPTPVGAAEGSEQDSFLRDPTGVVSFCAVCHGTDGLPRFRFFHGDQFRGDEDEP